MLTTALDRTPIDRAALEARGFVIAEGMLDQAAVRQIGGALGPVPGAGRRGLLDHPAAAAAAEDCAPLMARLLGGDAFPVRAIYFDKSPESNWGVAWHQDLTIAVAARAVVPGFGPWSQKGGVPCVQPPDEILARMLTIRLHLDDCDAENGALQVIPGTHRQGKLDADAIAKIVADSEPETCEAAAGDALLMRPLLLHASHRSRSDRHRRVLHLEFAACDLPPPLRWAMWAA